MVIANHRTAQAGQVSTRLESRSKIAGDGPDVSAFGTTDTEIYLRQFKTGDFELIDGHMLGLELCALAHTGKVVGSSAI